MKLLLVEDEEELREALCKGLRNYGYAVDAAADGEEALDFFSVAEYDVIILDLNLPKVDGFEVLRLMKKRNQKVKILILSALNAVSDRVKGLDMGANDYLSKPFDFRELEARIRNLSRISYNQHENELTCGSVILDMASKNVTVSSNIIQLTKKEYAVLEYLMLNKNKVISVDKFLDHIWESDADFYPDVLKYHIHTIKKKLAEAGVSDFIKNVRGIGYKIEEE